MNQQPTTHRGRFVLGVWLVLAVGSGTARAELPPEVVRVRVPSARVAAYFPSGTALRTLSLADFDALVAAATARTRAEPLSSRRAVRIEHFARWEEGALVGRSRVTLPATADTSVLLVVAPWSPALLASADREEFARVDGSGRLVLIQPARQPSRVVEIPWRELAMPGSFGRSFALQLPAADVAALTLDLPSGVVPSANAAAPGARQGPEPTATPGRSRWEFAGASGWFPIQLAAPAQADRSDAASQYHRWVGASTRVDLNAAAVNWVADWQVESTAEASPTCLIELDPSIELIDLTGPEVQGFRFEPRRVAITLRDPGSNRSRRTTVQIRGHVAAPLVGTWLVPSARPVDAGWLGGRTEVRLDPTRRVAAVEGRSGRRVAARPEEGVPASAYLFEADGRPGPVAEFRFERAEADGAVEIQGTLQVGPFAPRIEVAATWTLDRGRLIAPSLDFPAGWAVDRVLGADRRSTVAWHGEAIPGAGTRVHLDRPPLVAEPPGRTATLVIAATRVELSPASCVGPLALPRVRPPGDGPILAADERWTAEVAPGWEIQLTSSRGLAWLDPTGLADPPAGAGRPAAPPPDAIGRQPRRRRRRRART